MSKEKMIVSKGTIRIDNSDGTHTELGFVMPTEIAEEIIINIQNWKENTTTSVKTVESYQEAVKEFLQQLEEDKKKKK